jgi:prepilin-type N-terminal cleavage/methylation domain-containing protein
MRLPAAENSILKNEKGFTLLELIIVMILITIVSSIAILSYRSLGQRYEVERKVKQMYADMMNARVRAMQRGRDHFVSMPTGTTRYRIIEDTFTTPDGNGQLDANDTQITWQDVAPFTITLSAPTMTLVQFNSKGLVSSTQTGWVRIVSTTDGEYDCIVIDQIKTGMGKMNGANCIIK